MALREQKIPLLLNFSQCKLIASEFYPVIEHCSEVLEIDPGTILRLLANTFSAVSVQKVEIIFGITLIILFFSSPLNVPFIYRTRAIITRGLYTFYPLFDV